MNYEIKYEAIEWNIYGFVTGVIASLADKLETEKIVREKFDDVSDIEKNLKKCEKFLEYCKKGRLYIGYAIAKGANENEKEL